jgi:isoleucyl-tRNA synthetase
MFPKCGKFEVRGPGPGIFRPVLNQRFPMPPPKVFAPVPTDLDFPTEERAILALWKEKRIFEKSLEAGDADKSFVFYEGPPTANGVPHNGHVLTRVIKDLFPRYKTMRGYRVPRKAGWDTHGLPVEVEVEKELRIHGKAAIEEYGVEPFVRKCIESVFRYTGEWESLTERVAFWVDLKDAYVTYHKSYIESVWWALSQLFEKGLLYQGHKVVWWWAQGGTALSSAEVGLGYKTVDDPSAYVAFPLVEKLNGHEASLLVWTTTPWTLPSNMYAAVHPDVAYVVVRGKDAVRFVVAEALLEPLAKKLGCELVIEDELKGSALVGKEYRPPFETFRAERAGHEAVWRVLSADFVTLDTGTGIVHIAPAFGEDDYAAHKKLLETDATLPLFNAVKPDGTFIDAPGLAKYAGRWVKDCDKDLLHELKERGLLVLHEQYRHEYPFCWRADDDPLIQYARPAWYIRTTQMKDEAIANNRAVHWLPEHIKEGRFGDFLAHNVDWALSRERYWGTPLNVWICDQDATHLEAPSSVAAIEGRNPRAFDHFKRAREADPTLNEHLIVHKPWVDAVTFPCAKCGGTMKRVPEVIDCWFDSGCMPFAQWGFPHKGVETFKASFPADFISEAIDQTRGWFYSLLMISTLVFDPKTQAKLGMTPTPYPHPFETCIVLGHVSDKEGKKESKSKGNYTPPEVILDRVAMDFAVTDAASAGLKGQATLGHVTICREDMEGLDLEEGAHVRVYESVAQAGALNAHTFKVAVGKGMRRRVVVLAEHDMSRLGVGLTSTRDVKPVEVPRLPPDERVTIEDPSSSAPGADAFRWFFYASNPPWSNTRHSLSNVRALQKEFLIKLRNVYSFFVIYANIDGLPLAGAKSTPTELDRWIKSELALTARGVEADLDAYDVYKATQRLTTFVDALSNWYVRRSRDRFWRSGWEPAKVAAHETLYEVLVTTAKLIAPFVPYTAEAMYQNLVVGKGSKSAKESVHLERFPSGDPAAVDLTLSRQMAAIRDVVSVGLKVRTDHKLKVRQPLRRAHIVLNDVALRHQLADHKPMIEDELNVLEALLHGPEEAARFGHYSYKPNFRSLGQRGLGKQAQELKKAWTALTPEDRATLDAVVREGKGSFRGTELVREDVEASFETKPGFAAAGDRIGVVILETTLDDELKDLGFYRELLNRIQGARKELGLEYTDRIRVGVLGSERVRRIAEQHAEELGREALATAVSTAEAPADGWLEELEIEGETVKIGVARAERSVLVE